MDLIDKNEVIQLTLELLRSTPESFVSEQLTRVIQYEPTMDRKMLMCLQAIAFTALFTPNQSIQEQLLSQLRYESRHYLEKIIAEIRKTTTGTWTDTPNLAMYAATQLNVSTIDLQIYVQFQLRESYISMLTALQIRDALLRITFLL